MENWFDLIEPHRDIKEGILSESIFAADLGEVALGTAPLDYNDPYSFANNTYFTKGITDLLQQVSRKLTKGLGPGVIEIQTPFGGGKTHALIAIYHYVTNFNQIKGLLPQGLEPIKVKTAVIVGTRLNPVEGRNVNGTTLRTLWGELAYQLAGEKGYQEFKANDEKRISPGKDKLKGFLIKQQPFVLLFDETLEYIAKAIDAQSDEGNLGGQTFAFIQELTETVSSIENGMLIVTLPSSELEDYTPKKVQGLATLNKIFGRIETIATPVLDEEIYSIIKKRLFQKEKTPETIKQIIHDYINFYQNHPNDIPPKVRSSEFIKTMELSYPFHPDTIDLLYEKWNTFPTFQRTRGVLRLLANVVSELYKHQTNIDLILPSDLNLENHEIRREFLKHLDPGYDGIIASDFAGPNSKAQVLDKQNPSYGRLAQKISTAIFLHSFSATQTEQGIDLPYIKMTTMRTDTIPSVISEILHSKLTGAQGQLWYLNEKEGRYYFSNIPSLRKMIRDRKEMMGPELTDEVKKLIEKEAGSALATFVWPLSHNLIPDNRQIKLILTDPSFSDDELSDWLDKKGNNFRVYKNSIIFALADTIKYSNFVDQKKEYKALKEIRTDIKEGRLSSLESKLQEIEEEIEDIEDDFQYNIKFVYSEISAGTERLDPLNPSVARETLSTWIKKELLDKEKIVQTLHYNTILKKLMENYDQLETKTILEQFYKNTDLPMIDSEEVVKRSLQMGIRDGAFAISIIKDDKISDVTLRYKIAVPLDEITFDSDEYIIKKEKVENLICPECGKLLQNGICPDICDICRTHLVNGICPKCTIPSTSCPLCGTKLVDGKCPNTCPDCSQHLIDGRCPNTCPICGTHLVGGECPKCKKLDDKYRYINLKIEDLNSSKIADLNRGIFLPITNEVGSFNFTLEIKISSEDGIEKQTIDNTVKETIQQLGAKLTKEEKR